MLGELLHWALTLQLGVGELLYWAQHLSLSNVSFRVGRGLDMLGSLLEYSNRASRHCPGYKTG